MCLACEYEKANQGPLGGPVYPESSSIILTILMIPIIALILGPLGLLVGLLIYNS